MYPWWYMDSWSLIFKRYGTKAVSRIRWPLKNGELITVYGDYDAGATTFVSEKTFTHRTEAITGTGELIDIECLEWTGGNALKRTSLNPRLCFRKGEISKVKARFEGQLREAVSWESKFFTRKKSRVGFCFL